MLPNPEFEPQPLEEATSEALEGEKLRSHDWKRLAAALEIRRERYELDLENADEFERPLLELKIAEINEQIAVLQEEVGISKFIEDTVKFSYEVRRLSEG